MPVSLPDAELRAWLRLSMEPDLTVSAARQLLSVFGLPPSIYDIAAASLARVVPAAMATQMRSEAPEKVLKAIDSALAWVEDPRHHILTLADDGYPRALFDTHDPPLVLYVNGDPALLSRPAIAVVGARSATPGGADNARAFARHLAGQGWCVVSGLALGIDAAAHEGAMLAGEQGGRTVAVMGTGIDIVYPAANRSLAHRIAASGALVSEFPMGAKALRHHFPRRNRVVAGLARGVLVVEAARQSGSLITARLASDSGREVFAIPGSIHSPLSRGCHALIRQGARLVESGQDILEELGSPQSGLIGAAHRRLSAQSAATAPLPFDEQAESSEPPFNEQTGSPELPLNGPAEFPESPSNTQAGSPASPLNAQTESSASPFDAQTGPSSSSSACSSFADDPSLAAQSSASSPADTAPPETGFAFPNDADPHNPAAKILLALGYDPVDVDVLALRSGLDISAVNIALLGLELSGLVIRLPGGQFQRAGA